MKKVLIVIDMQNDFVDGALANSSAQAIVSPITEYVRAYDGTVVATRDTHGENYLDTAEGKKLPVVHCVENTHGWQIVPTIAAALEERKSAIIDKPTFGYLQWDMLAEFEEAELIGTCTDICVVSNALVLKAKFPNLRVKVNHALCAGTTQENHDAALRVMACCQVELI